MSSPSNEEYTLFGIVADVAQLARAHIRGETDGVQKNIDQIIEKLEKIKGIL